MIIKKKLGPRGQLVIPKDVREHLGVREGSEVQMEIRELEIVIRPSLKGEEALEKFLSSVKIKVHRKLDLKEIIEEQYVKNIDLPRQ